MSLHLNLSTGKFLNSSTLFKLSDALLLDVSSGEIVMSNLLVPREGVDLFKLASLDLNFAQSKSLTDQVSGTNLITFSRASSGTYVDSDGLIKTATTDAPRFDHDPVTGKSLGLLIEEARTNLFLNSDTLSTQSVTSAATEYALSFYGTGTVTLSGDATGTLVGTGVNERVSLVVTATAGTITATVTGTVEKGQIEAGSFPTSYIPTTSSAVTRAADVASIEGTNFSSWFNQSEGTVFTDVAAKGVSGIDAAFAIGSSNDSDRWLQQYFQGSSVFYEYEQGSPPANSYTVGSFIKSAIGRSQGDNAVGLNGSIVQSDTYSGTHNPVFLKIGVSGDATRIFNGHIKRLAYFPTRKTDQELIDLTLIIYSYGEIITNYPYDLGALPEEVTRYIDLEKEYYTNAEYDLRPTYSYGEIITNYPYDLGALPAEVTQYIDLEKEYYANAEYDLN